MRAKLFFSVLTASLLSFGVARQARAACTNDVDCPMTACGGQVCDWPAHACMDPDPSAQGSDGWCTTPSDCKCMGEGATCIGVHCTFTVPTGGGDGGAPASDPGVTVDAGETVDATAVTQDASAVDDAGFAEDAAPTQTPTSSTASDSGGCSLAAAGAVGVGSASTVGGAKAMWTSLLGLVVVGAGRRKRARTRADR